ncbi:MAG: NAD(+) synthase [Candidatus Yanofskybacteria bacterium]|nr:NAD(+) synthase [Candidatus Yanofskybacteria bacterium]
MPRTQKSKESRDLSEFGFVRVASAVPKLAVGDVSLNCEAIVRLIGEAYGKGVAVVVFPELCVTGYTLGDIFHQQLLQKEAVAALDHIRKATAKYNIVSCIGLPLAIESKLFNVAAVISIGKILGVVPKTYIPGYKEFYEERWFASARDLKAKEVKLLGSSVPVGTDLLFRIFDDPNAVLGVEICEDVWTPLPPSSFQVLAGANIIANLSASNDLVGKAEYRRDLISQQSARAICGYIYTSCGVHESTTDLVFGGHSIIGENGSVLAESERFSRAEQLIIADIDIEHLKLDRERTTSFGESVHESGGRSFRLLDVNLNRVSLKTIRRYIDPHPFVPYNSAERDKRAEEIFAIQTAGLAKRLEQTGIKKIVLGLSGGLDSTLALLVAVRTCILLRLPLTEIYALTMPGFATTKRTKSNAIKLAKILGITLDEIDITAGTSRQLKDIRHDGTSQDITFENAQARYRTMTLMNRANQIRGLVLGTGDLSEIALGWCTFTGDHISHYNVNASVPKTLVRYLVKWVGEQKDFKNVRKVLDDILATPVSPELVRSKGKKISQETESIIGPYQLHDFFLYHFVRWGSAPSKIRTLAELVFADKYPPAEIRKWLKVFIMRFFNNQWKRSVMPDGPKIGSVSLSPRGDWRMPSDAEVSLWLKDLEDEK